MSWLPNDLQLRQGAVFRMMRQYNTEGEKYRFFIVLNFDPQSDKIIMLTTTTTQLEKLEHRYGSGDNTPLVYIHHSDYADIERFCAVDCSAVESWEKTSLLTAIQKKGGAFQSPLPDLLLEKIIGKITVNKTIAPSIKCLIVKRE